jgi:hypothetical protein
MEGDKGKAATTQPTSWASLLQAYREGPREQWSGLLVERLGPWLTVAKRQLRAVPPYLDSDDVAQELAFEVLRIAARWRPTCEDRWIPRRLVERAARRVGEVLLRERLAANQELDPDLELCEQTEPELVFDTPVGKATASDLRVIYRAKVLGEPIEVLAREAGFTSAEMRRRLRAARARARSTSSRPRRA